MGPEPKRKTSMDTPKQMATPRAPSRRGGSMLGDEALDRGDSEGIAVPTHVGCGPLQFNLRPPVAYQLHRGPDGEANQREAHPLHDAGEGGVPKAFSVQTEHGD